ncbi:MAG: DUF882 domain-containing protein [Alphaproteobacteria bacterium]|nr:DUF882 domain-containing protein [Alphaproteobacteria bacterium]
MNLTPHFTLEELCRSDKAAELGIKNDPPPEAIYNLRLLCEKVLEPLRSYAGAVTINSGYRCPELNRHISKAKNSQHMIGQAADIVTPRLELKEAFNFIFVHCPFDQVIREYPPGGWVHVSYSATRNRGNGLVTVERDGTTAYLSQGLIV